MRKENIGSVPYLPLYGSWGSLLAEGAAFAVGKVERGNFGKPNQRNISEIKWCYFWINENPDRQYFAAGTLNQLGQSFHRAPG